MWLNNNSWRDRFAHFSITAEKKEKMRYRFENSCNMNILRWTLYRKINSIRTCSSRKVEFLSKITSFLRLKFEYANYLFPFKDFYVVFMTLQSIGFKCFAKIMKGSCVFCCSSCVSFIPTSHLKGNEDEGLVQDFILLLFPLVWIKFTASA